MLSILLLQSQTFTYLCPWIDIHEHQSKQLSVTDMTVNDFVLASNTDCAVVWTLVLLTAHVHVCRLRATPLRLFHCCLTINKLCHLLILGRNISNALYEHFPLCSCLVS